MAQKIPDEKLGSYRLRIRPAPHGAGFNGLVFDSKVKSDIMQADSAEELRAQLLHWVGSSHANYIGWEDTKARFLEIYPEGFKSEAFEKKERTAKSDASKALKKALPASLNGDNQAAIDATKAAISATTLLSPVEKKRMIEILSGDTAEALLNGAAAFAEGRYEAGLDQMNDAIKTFAPSTWTLVTYLPFLWNPDEHFFLKPEVTKMFSKRVGHPFHHQYAPALHPRVYLAALNLVAEAAGQVADLKPRDNIDIQGFIATIGKLKDIVIEDDDVVEDDDEEDDIDEEDEVPGIDE